MNSVVGIGILAAFSFVGFDSCGQRHRPGGMDMCGPCVESADCRTGFSCVNETCETVPPSCHVRIGL